MLRRRFSERYTTSGRWRCAPPTPAGRSCARAASATWPSSSRPGWRCRCCSRRSARPVSRTRPRTAPWSTPPPRFGCCCSRCGDRRPDRRVGAGQHPALAAVRMQRPRPVPLVRPGAVAARRPPPRSSRCRPAGPGRRRVRRLARLRRRSPSGSRRASSLSGWSRTSGPRTGPGGTRRPRRLAPGPLRRRPGPGLERRRRRRAAELPRLDQPTGRGRPVHRRGGAPRNRHRRRANHDDPRRQGSGVPDHDRRRNDHPTKPASVAVVVWTEHSWTLTSGADYETYRPIDEQLGDHERLRLLYVACTRARDHLVVSLHRTAPQREVESRNIGRRGTRQRH